MILKVGRSVNKRVVGRHGVEISGANRGTYGRALAGEEAKRVSIHPVIRPLPLLLLSPSDRMDRSVRGGTGNSDTGPRNRWKRLRSTRPLHTAARRKKSPV